MPKQKSRRQKGGSSPSGWGYVYNQVGDGWTQFQNALTLQPGQNSATQQSNDIEPIGKPNFQNTQSMPSKTDLSLIQRAGKRRKKAGSWSNVISQAAVPFTLLGLQNSYGKRKSRKHSRRQSRKKRGGSVPSMLGQAAVPLTLLGLQNSYGKRKSRRKSRRNRK